MSNVDTMRAILAYCVATHRPCWAIHTLPRHQEKSWGGTSCELVNIIGDTAGIRIANGDRFTVPVSEISMRGVA